MRTLRRAFVRLLCFIAVAGAASCSGGGESAPADSYVARVGAARLTAEDIRRDLPGGLSPDDSARFVKAYVNSWIDAHLVSEIASSAIDMEQIDRLTDEYRNELILRQYARKMFEIHAPAIPEDSLRAYYEAHKEEFRLKSPLVRGVYLKVPDDAAKLRTIRRLYLSDKPADIDKLEKEVLGSAIHYDYFRDHWVDWVQIETRIPADFGAVPSQWPAKGRSLDTSSGGFTYLLHVTDLLPAGSTAPYENSRDEILRRMIAPNRRAYETTLLRQLRDEALKNDKAAINGDF